MYNILTAGLVLVYFLLADAMINSESDIQIKFKDCDHVRKSGFTKSGVYTLWMNETRNFKVYCQHTERNSYTVILQRKNGKVSFAQPWRSYLNGFGTIQGDYWAGLNQIYYLTSIGNNVLQINMQDWNGSNRNVRYSYFKLMDQTYFRLSVGGFTGQVHDDLIFNNNMRFGTYDQPDAHHCAKVIKAGWWFNRCTKALLTGKYYHGNYPPPRGFYDGIYWKDWRGYSYSFKYVNMTLSSS